ncbi:MAG: D-alanyl-D-alanine carboxypeptidase [Evtepia sp.]|jgi:D-alanyl-D-alanine carboxypeptidase (penicillin-binding protein 5/6)|nr:D-alanyl-D-alanine carboxypeptidase [Evtepia sp.]
MKKMIKQFLSFALMLTLLATILPCSVFASDLTPITASAALLIDLQQDTILYEKNAHEKRPPASITKVMTGLLVIEAIERGELTPQTVFTATDNSISDITDDSSTQEIKPGEQMSVEELLYCLLGASANEAANVLAEGLSGSVSAFVDVMNTRAGELGMTDTHFSNPHGLHRDDHYSSAYDIFLMTKESLKHPLFQKIVSTSFHKVPATNLSGERSFTNTNALLTDRKYTGYTYAPATGVKTGHTPEAGYCLVSSAQKNGRTLIAVVLGAEMVSESNGNIDRRQFSESRRLLQWGFSNFKVQTLLGPDTLMREIPVHYGKGVSYVLGYPSTTIEAVLPLTFDPKSVNANVTLIHKAVNAPVKKGQVLGHVTVSYAGKEYGSADLVAVSDVEPSAIQFLIYHVKVVFGSLFARLLMVAFVIWLVLRFIRSLRPPTPRRSKKGSNTPKKKKPSGLPPTRR